MKIKKRKKTIGRPPKTEEEKISKRLTVGFTKTQHQRYEKTAKRFDISISELLRLATDDFITKLDQGKSKTDKE